MSEYEEQVLEIYDEQLEINKQILDVQKEMLKQNKQFVVDKEKIEILVKENKALKENRDKIVEYIESHIYLNDDCGYGFEKLFTVQDEKLDKLLSELKGDK